MGKKGSTFVATALGLSAFAAAPALAHRDGDARAPRASADELPAPILFAENAGQLDPAVLFQARIPGLVASVLADGFALELAGAKRGAALRVRFEGAGPNARPEGLRRAAARAHFLTGSDPARWTRDVATWERVRVRGLAPGVDLELYESGGRVEYDLVLAPHADPAGLALVLEGAGAAWIDAEGALACEVGGRTLVQRAPVAWQTDAAGARAGVRCAWRALGGARFGFDVAGRDPARALVIDPVLAYATHVGGTNADEARDVFVDASGAVYVTGWARSGNFPLGPRALDATQRQREGVVFKLAPDGRELVWATYFGGGGDDEGRALAVDGAGRVFVAGVTTSADFPTTWNAVQRAHRGAGDAFALELEANGSALVYATYLGGSGEDELEAAVLGPDGKLHVAGTTRSRDFPTTFQALWRENRGGQDVFAAKLDELGIGLCYSTLLGGSGDDQGLALDVGADGHAFLTGRTASFDFPTTDGALDRKKCGVDAFALELGVAGGALHWSTLLGGSSQDEGRAIAADGRGGVLVAGWTDSPDLGGDPAQRAHGPGRRDGFVVRLAEKGGALAACAFVGGGGADECLGLALGPDGAPWVVGRTSSKDLLLTPDALQPAHAGGLEAFVLRLDPATLAPVYASFAGGPGDDLLRAVHVDAQGRHVACAGWADDVPLERRGPLGGRKRGPSDALVVRLESGAPAPAPLSALGSGPSRP